MTDSRRWLMMGACIGLGWVIYLLQPILTPFLLGCLCAYLGDPLADKLEERGFSRSLSVVVVFTAFTTLLTVCLVLLVPMLGKQVSYLQSKLPEIVAWVQDIALPWVHGKLGIDTSSFSPQKLQAKATASWQTTGNIIGAVLAKLSKSSLAFVAAIGNLALVPVVTFYLLRDWDVLMAHIRELLPRTVEPRIVTLAGECDDVMGAFLKGQLLVMICLGVIYTFGLWAVGLELALLIGMLAGLASIVPYLGFIVGIAAALVASVFQFNDWLHPVLVIGVFMVGQALEGMVLTPLLVGDRIGLHPVAVIFAVLAGGQLFGFVGMLLALPVSAIIVVLLRHMHGEYLASDWYGAEPVGPAPGAVSSVDAEMKNDSGDTRTELDGSPTKPTSSK